MYINFMTMHFHTHEHLRKSAISTPDSGLKQKFTSIFLRPFKDLTQFSRITYQECKTPICDYMKVKCNLTQLTMRSAGESCQSVVSAID